MIVIYHGAKLYLPLMACCLHLDAQALFGNYLEKDWRQMPFQVVGNDEAGNTICCLVHGRYRGVYRRAIMGTGRSFGVKLRCIDIESMVLRSSRRDILKSMGLKLAGFLPGVAGECYRQEVSAVLLPYLQTGRGEQL